MKEPIHGKEINKILLKPRFNMEFNESHEDILQKFKDNLSDKECKYCSKQSGNLFFLDVPKVDEHFWSPQLQVEIVKGENDKTIIKGILGPKPQVWTFFMFIHFVLGLIFIVDFIMFYVKWSMDKEYKIYKIILIALPIIWVTMYFIGQYGKKLAYKQMVELDNFLKQTLYK